MPAIEEEPPVQRKSSSLGKGINRQKTKPPAMHLDKLDSMNPDGGDLD